MRRRMAARARKSSAGLTRTDTPSRVRPSEGMGMVYVRVASSPTTSMPCTGHISQSAHDQVRVAGFQSSVKNSGHVLIGATVGLSLAQESGA